eukprot:1076149-Lingulodinium_polyedra.AAC.1
MVVLLLTGRPAACFGSTPRIGLATCSAALLDALRSAAAVTELSALLAAATVSIATARTAVLRPAAGAAAP